MTQDIALLSSLKNQVQTVAATRDKAARLKKQRDSLLEEWNSSNRELLDALTQAGADVVTEEATLRELALQVYAATGNKVPVEGVGIREMIRLSYDPAMAFTWATEHKIALKLDVSAFEKIAKTSPIDFVSVAKEPQATIATNLSSVKA